MVPTDAIFFFLIYLQLMLQIVSYLKKMVKIINSIENDNKS